MATKGPPPTAPPSPEPTPGSTPGPTASPTNAPTNAPRNAPTNAPTYAPTKNPAAPPTAPPTPSFVTKYFTSEQLLYLDKQVGKKKTEARSNIKNTLNIDYVAICNTHPHIPSLTKCPFMSSGVTYVQLDVDTNGYVIAVRIVYDEGLYESSP